MFQIDLNSDLGESFGSYKLGLDDEVLAFVTSANVACGWHAGDPLVMDRTVALAADRGVFVGAFPDLLGFGRRNIDVTPKEAYAYTKYQPGAFFGFAKAHGLPVQHIKPHGALYNMCAKNSDLSFEVCRAVREFDDSIIVMGLAGSELLKAARDQGLRAAGEFFADCAYNGDGTLVSRRLPGSVITDENAAIARTVRMAKEGVVETIDGADIPIVCQSVCVHGDNAHAVAFVEKIRRRLSDEGISVTALRNIV